MSRASGWVVAIGVAVATVGPCRGAAQESFRTSLTATVSRLPEADSVVAQGEVEHEAEAAPDAVASERLLLRCRRVTLNWAPLPRAGRYTIYVSVDGRDGWRPLSPRNACGESRVTGATTVVDIEPTTGGATVVRRLYYRVEAFDRADADARLIETTTPVPVELLSCRTSTATSRGAPPVGRHSTMHSRTPMNPQIPRSMLLPAALMALSVIACRKSEGSENTPAADSTTAIAGANVVKIEATEFAFDAPDTIRAGLTTFRFIDTGKQLHHAQLVRLNDGKTMADLESAMKKGGPVPGWMVFAGGPNAPRPGGGVAEATEELEPGNYAIICVIPGPDHVPHIMKGMAHPLTVTPAVGPVAAAPKANLVVHMDEYSYELSAPITAGEHRLRVENDGTQPHELELVRLADGKTVVDLEKWIDSQQGPPPGEPLGGVATTAPGEDAYFSADFTPGRYALICFVPDAGDGKPHFLHGMAKEITVS